MNKPLIRTAVILSLGAALAACVTATPYQPRERGFGYAPRLAATSLTT